MVEQLDKEFFAKNLQCFKKYFPHIYVELNAIQKTHSELLFNENGSPDIVFRGQKLYNCDDLDQYVDEHIEAYFKRRKRIYLIPPNSANLDDVASEYNYNVLKKATDLGATFQTDIQGEHTHYMVSFGVGLGKHLLPLAKRSNCAGLILIEPNIEFLYHSLFVTDWTEILELFNGFKDGRYLFITCNQNPLNVQIDVTGFMRGVCAPFVDGIDFYSHYPSSQLAEMHKLLQKEANLAIMGLGFYIDEEIMLRNSYNNLKNYNSYIFTDCQQKVDLPIFIIGSGPSLSQSLDYIRENQDNAIIVSGGTALAPLLKAGIQPDFQVEVENVEASINVLRNARDNFDISDITLVTTTTMQPDAINCFDKKVLYFRQSLTSTPVFTWGAKHQLLEVSPTVTNAALSFAQQVGGKKLYFFGMDYGARKPDKMHIEGTAYDEGLKFDRQFTIKYKGNFGGHVYTDSILNWARSIAERSIRRFQTGHTYYNCSDGCMIKGAIPKLPRTLKPLPQKDKNILIDQIMNSFAKYSRADFEKSWNRTDWHQETLDLCDRILDILENSTKDNYWCRYIEEITRQIVSEDDKTTPSQFMLRGSMFLTEMTSVFYPPRIADPEIRKQVEEIVREELIKTVTKLKERVDLFFNDLVASDTSSK